MALTCCLVDEAWLGIHYMPTPMIVLQGTDATNNSNSNPIVIGATTWIVVDGNDVVVGAGTMLSSAGAITICSGGVWIGGTIAVPGYFTVYTNNGTNGVTSGACCICTANSKLYVPNSAGDQQWNLSGWLGGSADRASYQIPASTAAQIVTQRGIDEYFVGPQDSARPHKLWISSSTQANSPTQGPTSSAWGTAIATIAASYPGSYPEMPTNEFENGGWSQSGMTAYWNAAGGAVHTSDSTAHLMGPCSGGFYNDSPISVLTYFLANATSTVGAVTNHMESSKQNLANVVALRQYRNGVSAVIGTTDYWNTETGICGGLYSVLQIRRDARQRTVFRQLFEEGGYAKENCFMFPVYDVHGSGIQTYLVDGNNGNGAGVNFGNLRAGAYAMHVQAEALFGTTCTPTDPPTKLSFGATGSLGDSLFFGHHYTAAGGDVVVLGSNGLESYAVTLAVSSHTGVYAWDGWGAPRTVTISGGNITVAGDDLLTYIFLPASTTVSVVDTDTNVISALNSATNIAATAGSVVNENATNIAGVINNGSFAENLSGVTGVTAPYTDATGTPKVIFSSFSGGAQYVRAVVIYTGGPAWQNDGCSLTAFSIYATIGGVRTLVYSYTCPSASSLAVPSPSNSNSSDQCTRTNWWKAPFAFIVPLSLSGPVTAIEFDMTPNWGGQATQADWALVEQGTGIIQQFVASEIQIYLGGEPGVSPGLYLAGGQLTRV